MFNLFKKPMNDPEAKSAAENPFAAREDAGSSNPVADIQRTMPALDGGGDGGGTGSTPAATPFSAPKRAPGQRGPDKAKRKPKGAAKNPFAAPQGGEAEPFADAAHLSGGEPEQMDPPRDPQDFIEYGECLSEMQIGAYEAKAAPTLAVARRKLPPDTLEVVSGKLLPSERTKKNFEKGWAALAEYFNAPKGGAVALAFIASCRAYHVQFCAGLDEIKSLLEKLPDIEQPPAEPVRRNTL